jgi:hypothetical protein
VRAGSGSFNLGLDAFATSTVWDEARSVRVAIVAAYEVPITGAGL